MKHNMFQFHTKDFDFIITPTAIKSNKSIEGVFNLQLQKGCQHIANLDESIRFGINQTYIFASKNGITVKTFKQSCMNISWSLYKNTNNKLFEFIDIFTVNLQGYYLQYLQDLKKHDLQYSKIYQNKSNKLFLEQNWNHLKKILKHTKSNLQLKSRQGTFILDCSLQIKNEFDNIIFSQTQKKVLKIRQNSRKSLLKDQEHKKINQIKNYTINPLHIDQSKKKQQINVQIVINGISQPKNNLKEQINEQKPITSIMRKQNTVLSDIIEASVEQSRQQTTQQTQKIGSTQTFLTVNQNSEMKFIKTSTFHFQNQQNDEAIKIKRINSLESPKRRNNIQDQVQQQKYNMQQTDVQEIKTDKQSFHNSPKYFYSPPKFKYFIGIILFLSSFLFVFHSKIMPQQLIKIDSKKRKQKTNKIKVW